MQASSTLPSKRYLTQEIVKVEIYGKTTKLTCRMANMSISGAYFELLSGGAGLVSNELVCIYIHLRAINKLHTVNAEVVWSKGIGFGVQFLTKDVFNQKISKFLKSRMSN